MTNLSIKPNIQNFPVDVLAKIFSYVDNEDLCKNIPFVCKKWKIASSNQLLWKNVVFEGDSVSSIDIFYILRSGPFLKSITLVSNNNLVPILRQICLCNKQIEKLDLRDCSAQGGLVPEEVLLNVLISLQELQTIWLRGTKFESHIFFDIVARKSSITSIDVSLNEHLTLSDLMTLVHNSRIREFKMSRRCQQPEISDREMAHLIETVKHQLTLLHLDMSGMGACSYNELLNCSYLTDLKLNNAFNLTAELLSNIPRYLKTLQHLKIEGPSLIRKGDIYASLFENTSFKWSHQLKSLKIEHFDCFDDNECCRILHTCSNLTTLSIKGCKAVTIEGIYHPLLKLDQLTFLNVAFLGHSNLLKDVIFHLTNLITLVVDQSSYKLNGLSAVSLQNPTVKVIQLTNKKL